MNGIASAVITNRKTLTFEVVERRSRLRAVGAVRMWDESCGINTFGEFWRLEEMGALMRVWWGGGEGVEGGCNGGDEGGEP